jgi:transcriptional regulator with XRE-family HTH domain
LPEDDTPGGRIRRARVEKNMLLVDLAAATGLSVRSLRLVEQNKSTVSPPNLKKLAEALGVSIAYVGCFESFRNIHLNSGSKKVRLYHGYNKRDFAKKIGVSARMILWWEKDEYRPSEKYMECLDTFLAILYLHRAQTVPSG